MILMHNCAVEVGKLQALGQVLGIDPVCVQFGIHLFVVNQLPGINNGLRWILEHNVFGAKLPSATHDCKTSYNRKECKIFWHFTPFA